MWEDEREGGKTEETGPHQNQGIHTFLFSFWLLLSQKQRLCDSCQRFTGGTKELSSAAEIAVGCLNRRHQGVGLSGSPYTLAGRYSCTHLGRSAHTHEQVVSVTCPCIMQLNLYGVRKQSCKPLKILIGLIFSSKSQQHFRK